MWSGLKILLCRHCENRKDSEQDRHIGNVHTKIVKSPFLVKYDFSCRFTKKETHFIPFKDLSCILTSELIFRQWLKFHGFSIFVTQPTGFQMSCNNTKGMKLQQSIDSKWVTYHYIISICIAKALLHIKNRSSH